VAISLKRIRDRWLHRVDYRVDREPLPRMIKWTLVSSPLFKIFVHKFNGPDWSIDPHDHPADFISIGLRGSYVEAVYDAQGRVVSEKHWRAPWFRTFPAAHIHRTTAVGPQGALTVCFAGPARQSWSFFLGRDRIDSRDYVKRFRSRRSDTRVQRVSAAHQPAHES
jgi:hypothetical protein